MKGDNYKRYALIAAVCYAIYAGYSGVSYVSYIIDNPMYVYYKETNLFLDIFKIIALASMGITLFVRNEKAIVCAAAGNAWVMIWRFIWMRNASGAIFAYEFWGVFSYASLIVIFILEINGKAFAKKIWFSAGLFMLWARFISEWSYWLRIGALRYYFKYVVIDSVEIAALFLVGMWVKEKIPFKKPEKHFLNHEYGGADKLQVYKELLDSGTITQDEFEEKKKQILRL